LNERPAAAEALVAHPRRVPAAEASAPRPASFRLDTRRAIRTSDWPAYSSAITIDELKILNLLPSNQHSGSTLHDAACLVELELSGFRIDLSDGREVEVLWRMGIAGGVRAFGISAADPPTALEPES
jgi:hypothetical protein